MGYHISVISTSPFDSPRGILNRVYQKRDNVKYYIRGWSLDGEGWIVRDDGRMVVVVVVVSVAVMVVVFLKVRNSL